MAVTAVQALCNNTKKKLPAAIINDRLVRGSEFGLSIGREFIASFQVSP